MKRKASTKSRRSKPSVVRSSTVQATRPVMRERSNNQALAIVCLILNALVLPGLGSLIGRKTAAGVWQLVLFILGIPLILVLIGIPMIVVAWVWGIVTGVKLIQESH